MSSTSMRRRMVRWSAVALVLVAVAAAAPPAAQAASQVGYLNQEVRNYPDAQPNLVGSLQMIVYSDHRKDLKVCDLVADKFWVVVQIDPTGSGPPDTLKYGDENHANTGCGDYRFWYPVRKWRILVWDIEYGLYTTVGVWNVFPLPNPDF